MNSKKLSEKVIPMVFGALLVFSMFSIGQHAQASGGAIVPPPGLLSWWPGDGNALDIIGHNDGTLMNGASFVNGKVGQAFKFDCVDDYVVAPSTNIGGLQRLTIDLWVKLNSFGSGPAARFISIGSDEAVLRLDEYSPPHEYLHFYIRIDGQIESIFVDNVLQVGTFHHVAGTYDGTVMRLYLDGSEVGNLEVSGTIALGSGIDLSGPHENERLDGLLDEVEIFGRALDASEVQAIYSAGSAGMVKPSSTEEVIVNGGFESGDLTGWTVGLGNGSAAVVTTNPYSGGFCACITGLNGLFQGFQGIPTSSIQSITYCKRTEPGSETLALQLLYSDGWDEIWDYVDSSWSFFDVTSRLKNNNILIGVQLPGWANASGAPMNTYYDWVSILYSPPPTYNVTVNAHCNIDGADVSVGIGEDGSATGFNTPYTFLGLNGSHTFSVPSADAGGHPFVEWSTGQTTTTIAVSAGGTYAAYYGTPSGIVIRVPEDYKSVQTAIDAAPPGSTIMIGPGVYNESITINKNLTIIGRLGSEPVFSGGGSGIAITLLSDGSGTVIAGIVITNWDQGILINNASGCKIYDNIMSQMSSSGIVSQGANASNNQVYNNIFQQDTIAISVASSSRNNNVSRNIISLSITGLKIESSDNVVCENVISDNQVGLNIVNSNVNIIFHNNFVNNTAQVSILTSTGNTWDDGYPSGGNYWSGYTGPDVHSGPNQDQPSSDGIVDTPHTVAGSDVDRYPLAQPFNAHDVGITDYSMSKTVVGASYNLRVEVKILNYGVYDENFLVTAYANTSATGAQAVTLTKSSSIILTLTWNTTGSAYGNYTVSACAELVQNETDTTDNNCTCNPPVHVGVPGDISGPTQGVYDGKVNMRDIQYMILLFNTKPGSKNWNSNADVNGDGVVNMRDIQLAILNFNRHE